MISFETARDGFILTVDGRRVLRHRVDKPCVELAAAEHRFRQSRGFFSLSARRPVPKPLGQFELRYRAPDRTVVEFGGILSLSILQEGGILRLGFSCSDRSLNHFRIHLGAHPQERIYGCGEQYTRLDLKGRRVPLWVDGSGPARGGFLRRFLPRHSPERAAHRTPFPVPAFISTRNYWAAVSTGAYTVFSFGKSQTCIECWNVPDSITMGFGCQMPPVLGSLTTELGRQREPPDWVYDGAILGLQGGLETVRRRIATAAESGTFVSAVCIEDWCGLREASTGRQPDWNWRADTLRYPGLDTVIRELRSRGLRFLGYLNPFLAIGGSVHAEATKRGYCVKKPGGGDYQVTSTPFPAAMVDLTNPHARRWFKDLIRIEMLDRGMSGWIADCGEHLPVDAVLHSGESASLLHNRWPVLWASLNREAVAEWALAGSRDNLGKPRDPSEILVSVRSGWLGSAREAASVWTGDRLMDFSPTEGLPSVIPATLSLGFSGLGFSHSDIGGHSSAGWLRRSPRCLGRWMEMAAFSPVFRTHEGSRPDRNSQFWSEASLRALFARCSEIYSILKPYHRVVARDYSVSGLPPIRHPALHYESEEPLHEEVFQYLYGRDILVAPVLDADSTFRSLQLPDDTWIHLWSSRRFGGGRIVIETPFGYPAVFYREASPFAALFDAIRRTVVKI